MREEKKEDLQRVYRVLLWLVFIPCMVGFQWWQTLVYVEGLSPVADPYSEADAIRGAAYFLDHGLLATAGLPDINYGSMYRSSGTAALFDLKVGDPYVYLHYPPGPQYLVSAMAVMCGGVEETACLRLFPLFAGTVVIILFLASIHSLLSTTAATIFTVLFLLPPVTLNMMHGLHHQSFTHTTLLLQITLYLLFFGRYYRRTGVIYPLLFLSGFIHGWLSFDYVFLACFSGLPVYFRYRHRQQSALRVLLPLSLPLIGFCFAHLLHFLQVAAYLGGIMPAVTDYMGAAQNRSTGIPESSITGSEDRYNLFYILRLYVVTLSDQPLYFSGLFLPVVCSVFVLLCIKRFSIKTGSFKVEWSGKNGGMLALLSSLLIALGWISLMRQHAYYHAHFLPRHLFLPYVISLWLLCDGIRISQNDYNLEAED